MICTNQDTMDSGIAVGAKQGLNLEYNQDVTLKQISVFSLIKLLQWVVTLIE